MKKIFYFTFGLTISTKAEKEVEKPTQKMVEETLQKIDSFKQKILSKEFLREILNKTFYTVCLEIITNFLNEEKIKNALSLICPSANDLLADLANDKKHGTVNLTDRVPTILLKIKNEFFSDTDKPIDKKLQTLSKIQNEVFSEIRKYIDQIKEISNKLLNNKDSSYKISNLKNDLPNNKIAEVFAIQNLEDSQEIEENFLNIVRDCYDIISSIDKLLVKKIGENYLPKIGGKLIEILAHIAKKYPKPLSSSSEKERNEDQKKLENDFKEKNPEIAARGIILYNDFNKSIEINDLSTQSEIIDQATNLLAEITNEKIKINLPNYINENNKTTDFSNKVKNVVESTQATDLLTEIVNEEINYTNENNKTTNLPNKVKNLVESTQATDLLTEIVNEEINYTNENNKTTNLPNKVKNLVESTNTASNKNTASKTSVNKFIIGGSVAVVAAIAFYYYYSSSSNTSKEVSI